MALVEEKYTDSTDGIKKTIDKGSMHMALDILQRGIYAHPIQSTVRELASNGYDAVKERDVAKAIISGTTKVEDHFDVTKVDGIFHASGWDPTYFDLNWLSDDSNVYLYYDEGLQKDTLRIVDHGVGLGKTRLVNYFMLNWSSKRSNKDSLGRWGLGSKVALSLGVSSFRVISKYNGRKFKFDVFVDKIESIIPKFTTKGVANEPFVLVPEKTVINEETGETEIIPAYVAYCEATTDKNGVEIQIEVKKHNKDYFFEAIEAQLMYMPGIKFMHKPAQSTTYTVIDIAAKILYRDEHVIISESTVFDKPHILLGTGDALVNYGFLAFNELELEPKRGSVGLIMDINDIEVTPSRESPIWNAKTRAAVLAKYEKVSQMASKYLSDELAAEKDYLSWVSKAAQILGSMRQGGSNTSVLGRLASVINIDDIASVTYPLNNKILFDPKPKEMFGNSLTVRNVFYERYRKKVERKALTDLSTLIRPLYFTTAGSNPFKDRYLFEENGDFVLINIKDQAVLDEKGALIVKSPLLKDYDAVVIPQDRLDIYIADSSGDITEDEDADDAKQAAKIDYSASRKANQQIVVHELSGSGGTYDYKFSARDVYISDLFNTQNRITLYTTGGDRETMSNLLALFNQNLLSCGRDFYAKEFREQCVHTTLPPEIATARITGVLVAQENVKYIENSSKYLSIGQFLVKDYNKKTKLVTFSDLIKFQATNSVLYQIYQEKFSNNMGYIAAEQVKFLDPKLQKVALFLYNNFHDYDKKPLRDLMAHTGFLKDAALYHLYKSQTLESSDEAIEELLKRLNTSVPDYLCDIVDEIEDIDILDTQLIKSYIDLFDYYIEHAELIALMHNVYIRSNGVNPVLVKTGQSLQEFFKFVNSQ